MAFSYHITIPNSHYGPDTVILSTAVCVTLPSLHRQRPLQHADMCSADCRSVYTTIIFNVRLTESDRCLCTVAARLRWYRYFRWSSGLPTPVSS